MVFVRLSPSSSFDHPPQNSSVAFLAQQALAVFLARSKREIG
jgi:hypothetical protein